MADIKVIEKIVSPAACWFTVSCPSDEDADAVIKVVLDRPYPYIWVNSEADDAFFGLALTYEDVERAAIIDPETDTVLGFDLSADGILSGSGYNARCISTGARKEFYVVPGYPCKSNRLRYTGLAVSAQYTPVCPFMRPKSAW